MGTAPVALCEWSRDVVGVSSVIEDGVTVLTANSPDALAGQLDELDVGAVAVRRKSSESRPTGPLLVAVRADSVECASAPILLGELRRRGVDALMIETGDQSQPDPDDAHLLRLAAKSGRAVALISDPHPDLRHAVLDALRAWGSAAGPRHALLAGPRSFCAGVERAIEIVEWVLRQVGAPVYVRKQIVHNIHVVRDLEQRGRCSSMSCTRCHRARRWSFPRTVSRRRSGTKRPRGGCAWLTRRARWWRRCTARRSASGSAVTRSC
ncbi:4-hydroxy-3-methylbut-2-enyl diphosphate reductase [Lentzea flava]|nr:4-hydroxy-3-methylbut-2-enyl diphosphate reductase [Lentzea flava]